eukprot:m.50982 g.50982  ORF g.50982 m.50982 type:complete len:419 (-) comp18098_c0_seq1:112-1368(-)
MIHSIFIINTSGDVILEKHYRSVVGRSGLDGFFEAQAKAAKPEDVPVAIVSSRYYLVNILREKLYFVAVLSQEAPPLLIIEFLQRVVDVLNDYLPSCTEKHLLNNTVVAYQVLEEMLDNGFPLATEVNILKEMIKPPSWKNAFNSVTGKKNVRETLPAGQLTNTQWRRAGVKYTNNEIFVDLYEDIEAVLDRQGGIVACDIKGEIRVKCRLSGMPDLTLSFVNSRLVDDVAFHPCVRLQRWSAERVLSFVPPDGSFVLMSYNIGSASASTPLPVHVRTTMNYQEVGGSKFEIEVTPKNLGGQSVEELKISIPFPKQVSDVRGVPTFGSWQYDSISRTLLWNIRKPPTTEKYVRYKGQVTLVSGEPIPEGHPVAKVNFKITGFAASGLKVNRLDLYNEKYKPFKGVKYITRAGHYEVRM